MNKLIFILTLFSFFIFQGCSSKYDIETRKTTAKNIVKKHNFLQSDIDTKDFILRTYVKKSSKKDDILRVYIEGDGLAWVSKKQYSLNSTPINPIALKLASKDSKANIAYIARPCQYIYSKNCSHEYWTNKRYSKEVVNSINEAIEKLKNKTKSNYVELFGFSGGGAIAVLVSSKRDDVKKIVTIAGNLNHKLHSRIHNVSDLDNSLNPIDYVKEVSSIKQIHFVGKEDKIVPFEIAKSYKKSSKSKNIKVITVDEIGHLKGWEKKWSQLLNEI